MDQSTFKQLSQDFLSVLPSGFSAELYYTYQDNRPLRFSNNAITQNMSRITQSIKIKLIYGNKISIASSNMVSSDSLHKLLRQLIESIQFQKEGSELLPLTTPQTYRVIHNFDDTISSFSFENQIDKVRNSINQAEKKKLKAFGLLETSIIKDGYANSQGVAAFHQFTQAGYNLSLQDKDTHSGWWEFTSSHLASIPFDKVTERAIIVAEQATNPIPIDEGVYEVILSPEAVGELLSFLAFQGLGTVNIYEKNSFFSGKHNKKVFSEQITIKDDISHPLSNGIPFDMEGLPRQTVLLVGAGVFSGMVFDRVLAKRMKAESSGHSLEQPNTYGPLPLNLVLSHGKVTEEEMISSIDNGLYINRLHYTNLLNPTDLLLTGMTRDGFFRITKGKIGNALKNMRFTVSIPNILSNILSVGGEQRYVPFDKGMGIVVPALHIKEFTLSSSTEF